MDSDRETPDNDENSERCGVCNTIKIKKAEDHILNDVHLEMSPEAQMLVAGDLDQLVKRDNTDNFWIHCDGCSTWFHSSCVHVQEYESALIARYHCAECVPRHGPSTMKKPLLDHRHNDDNVEEKDLSVQTATRRWIADFIKTERDIPPVEPHMLDVYDDGATFMKNFDQEREWKNPVIVRSYDGLGVRMPEKPFGIDDVVRLVGEDAIIDTIDVYAQQSYHMTMGRFAELWNGPRERLYNILSLEISQYPLGEHVQMPELVRQLSWAERYWAPIESSKMYAVPDWLLKLVGHHPETSVLAEHVRSKPNVEKFCLLSMGGSFTDCHIDFGGSSVWYHVFEGAKVFYAAPPTEENLKIYEEHCLDEKKSEHYMATLLPDGLRRIEVKQGETLMIPSGWIHSVYTPVDSIVFGGNFLHDLNITMQLKINDIETKVKFDWKFMYPSFELVNWYAAQGLCDELNEANDDEKPVEPVLLEGAKALLPYLRKWMERDKQNNLTRTAANFSRGLSDLAKAIKKQEKYVRKSPNGKRKSKNGRCSSERETPEKKPRSQLQKQPSAFVIKQMPVASRDEIADLALCKLAEGRHPALEASGQAAAVPSSSPESGPDAPNEQPPRPLKILISKKQLASPADGMLESESEGEDVKPSIPRMGIADTVEDEELGAIFSRSTTSHGRHVRPSVRISGLVKGSDDAKEEPGNEKNFMNQFTVEEKRQMREAELAAEAEYSVFEKQEKKSDGSVAKQALPSRPSVIQLAPVSGQKKKKPTTVKQRLASKLRMKT